MPHRPKEHIAFFDIAAGLSLHRVLKKLRMDAKPDPAQNMAIFVVDSASGYMGPASPLRHWTNLYAACRLARYVDSTPKKGSVRLETVSISNNVLGIPKSRVRNPILADRVGEQQNITFYLKNIKDTDSLVSSLDLQVE